ncbi:hypothetical protein ACF1CY_000766 [Providencia rettgeri]
MITTIINAILIFVGGIYSAYQATCWLLMLWTRLRYKQTFNAQRLKKVAIKLMDAGKKTTGVEVEQVTIYYNNSQSHTFLSENASQQVRSILQFHEGLDDDSRAALKTAVLQIRERQAQGRS